jgi:hypothetical protein
MKKSDALWALVEPEPTPVVSVKATSKPGVVPEEPNRPAQSPENIPSTSLDALFPARPPEPPPATNLTARELGERAGASAVRYGLARDRWRQLSIVADVTHAAAKKLDERIANGVAWVERQTAAVKAAPTMAQKVEADRLLQEGKRQLEARRDERHTVGESLARIELDLERVATEMGDAEDAIRRALGPGARGCCCNECGAWIVSLAAHQETCKRR